MSCTPECAPWQILAVNLVFSGMESGVAASYTQKYL
jgi:hypothetical protein